MQELKAQHKNGRLLLVDLDVSKPESIRAAAEKTAQLLSGGLDNLVSNAGVELNGLKTFEELYAGHDPAGLASTVLRAFSGISAR